MGFKTSIFHFFKEADAILDVFELTKVNYVILWFRMQSFLIFMNL